MRKTGVLATAISFGLLASNAQSQTLDEQILTLTEHLFPLQYIDPESGDLSGATVDIVRKVLSESGVDVEMEIHPWTWSYESALAQENVLIFSMMRTESREDLFQWIGPVADMEAPTFYSFTADAIPITSGIDELREYQVCGNADTPAYNMLLNNGFVEGTNLFPVDDKMFTTQYMDHVRLEAPKDTWIYLLQGTYCDFYFALPMTLELHMQQDGVPSVAVTRHFSTSDSARTLYFAANRNFDTEKLHAIRQAYVELRESGELMKVCEASLGPDSLVCNAVSN